MASKLSNIAAVMSQTTFIMSYKSTFTEKLGFGLGELPGTMNSILAVVLTMFYTDNVGLAAGAVGTMFFVSQLFDGISDLLAGSSHSEAIT